MLPDDNLDYDICNTPTYNIIYYANYYYNYCCLKYLLYYSILCLNERICIFRTYIPVYY